MLLNLLFRPHTNTLTHYALNTSIDLKLHMCASEQRSECLPMCIALITASQINTNLLSVFICNDHKCNTLRVLHSHRIAYRSRSRRPDKHWNSLIPFWIINGKSINCTAFNIKMAMLMRDQNANWPVFVCQNCGSSRGIKNVKRAMLFDSTERNNGAHSLANLRCTKIYHMLQRTNRCGFALIDWLSLTEKSKDKSNIYSEIEYPLSVVASIKQTKKTGDEIFTVITICKTNRCIKYANHHQFCWRRRIERKSKTAIRCIHNSLTVKINPNHGVAIKCKIQCLVAFKSSIYISLFKWMKIYSQNWKRNFLHA